MDIIATLREKIDALDEGSHIVGLKAVLLHVETAARHLSRGHRDGDDTAFTDAIYRTNQAFEGSIKEAYRVLANKNPDRTTPYKIEEYLDKHKIFRSRILKQFTMYRTDWRNPSAHDYKLDFDEAEAFLAIVTVTAFACLLVDEIGERISFVHSQAEAEKQLRKHGIETTENLIIKLIHAIQDFSEQYQPTNFSDKYHRLESQDLGALHGFLSTMLPDVTTITESQLVGDRPFRADLLFELGEQKIILEFKRRFLKKNFQAGIAQLEHYMLISGIKVGILLFMPESLGKLKVAEHLVKGIDGKIYILQPFD